MNPYTVGRIDPRGLAMEVLTGRHQPPRDHLVAQDLLVSVDVGQIHLQGPDPLGDAPLNRDHSAAAMTRGTRSSGNGRS